MQHLTCQQEKAAKELRFRRRAIDLARIARSLDDLGDTRQDTSERTSKIRDSISVSRRQQRIENYNMSSHSSRDVAEVMPPLSNADSNFVCRHKECAASFGLQPFASALSANHNAIKQAQ